MIPTIELYFDTQKILNLYKQKHLAYDEKFILNNVNIYYIHNVVLCIMFECFIDIMVKINLKVYKW